MGKKLSNLSFLKKNIEKVFHFNGLIDPLYEEVVQKALRELEDNASDFDKVIIWLRSLASSRLKDN